MKYRFLKIINTIIIISVLTISIAGCQKKADTSDSVLLGEWVQYGSDTFIYSFGSDGTGTYSYGEKIEKFTYTDDGTTLKITLKKGIDPSVYTYEVDEKSLTLKDKYGDEVKFLRKELMESSTKRQ